MFQAYSCICFTLHPARFQSILANHKDKNATFGQSPVYRFHPLFTRQNIVRRNPGLPAVGPQILSEPLGKLSILMGMAYKYLAWVPLNCRLPLRFRLNVMRLLCKMFGEISRTFPLQCRQQFLKPVRPLTVRNQRHRFSVSIHPRHEIVINLRKIIETQGGNFFIVEKLLQKFSGTNMNWFSHRSAVGRLVWLSGTITKHLSPILGYNQNYGRGEAVGIQSTNFVKPSPSNRLALVRMANHLVVVAFGRGRW